MSEPLWSEPTEASKAMNAMIVGAARRSQGHTLSAGPEHDRLSEALSAWERVKNLPNDADEKLYAAVVLEKARAAAEAARLEHERPRNPDGTFAPSGFDGGSRTRGTFQLASAQESSSQLLVRSLAQARVEREASEADPGVTITNT
jgi:hypothetical protein